MTSVREFGGWTPVPLDPSTVDAVKKASRALKVRLGLRETPLLVRVTRSGVELRARHIAGFVQVGSTTVEIRPKFLDDRYDGDSWRDAFLAILAKLGRLSSLPRMAGARSAQGLADLMGLVIDDALAQAATEGLPRRYEERRERLPTLRGRLDTEWMWRRAVEPELLACRYDTFTDDTPAARLIKWAARELSHTVTSPALATQLRLHVDALVHVADEPPSELQRDQIVVPPQYGYLEDALSIARMLAAGDSVSISATEDAPARAFVWNTAEIFEELVFAICRAAMLRAGGSTTKTAYALARPVPGPERSRQAVLPTIPDVVVRHRRWVGVLDAKYKTLNSHPKTSDVYQVMAAGRLLGSDGVALVYPAHHRFHEPRTWLIDGAGRPSHLHALPLNLNMMASRDGFGLLELEMAQWLGSWRKSGGTGVLGSG